VGEHRAKGTVTDDADVRELGAVFLIDDQTAFLVRLEADVLKSKPGGVRSATDCNEDDIRLKL
jgi:hypothetical protein